MTEQNRQKLTGKELKEMSFEEIMDLSVDDVEELVGFIPVPHGIYQIRTGTCAWEQNEKSKKWRLKIPYRLVEVGEVLTPEKDEDGNEVEFSLDDLPSQQRDERMENLYPASTGLNYFVATWKEFVGGHKVQEFPELLSNLDLIVEIGARMNDRGNIQNGIKTVAKAG